MRKTLGFLVLCCAVGLSLTALLRPTEARRAEKPKAADPKAKAADPPGPPEKPAVTKPSKPVAEGEDVLKDVLAANSKKFPAPPAKFRAGHVTVRPIDVKMVASQKDGFTVSFPSHAPIVTPTVYKDMVLSSGGFHSKEFYAFDARTGQPRWGINLDDDGPSVAACDEDLCAFNTESCTLFVVDAKTGKMKWSLYLGDPLTSSPTIVQGKVYTSYPAPGHGKASHVLAAFDLKTGNILWQKWLDADVMSAPVAIGSEVYASTFAGTLYTFDGTGGDIRSARKVRATSAPTIAGGDVLYSQRSESGGTAEEALVIGDSGSGRTKARSSAKPAPYLDQRVQERSAYAAQGKALDASNGFGGGAPSSANAGTALGMIGKGSVSTMQSHQGSRVLRVGKNNVSAQGDELVSTGVDGTVQWTRKLTGDLAKAGGTAAAPPVAAGGHLIVATMGGDLLDVDSKSGVTNKTFHAGGILRTQPAVVDGWIYVGTEDGKLIAIDTHDKALTGWSTWGGDAQRSNVR
jgi:outer membrane protein assembly factor BamB